jgi:hypothetical protein
MFAGASPGACSFTSLLRFSDAMSINGGVAAAAGTLSHEPSQFFAWLLC